MHNVLGITTTLAVLSPPALVNPVPLYFHHPLVDGMRARAFGILVERWRLAYCDGRWWASEEVRSKGSKES